MALKAILVLVCLTALLAVNSQDYQPVSKFKLSKLFDTKWYELIYADNTPFTLNACTRVLFNKEDSKHFSYKLGQLNPGLGGEFEVNGAKLTVDSECQGRFSIDGAPSGNYVYILDYARDYDWIVWADTYTFGGFISLLSRTPKNLEGINRFLEIATKYGQNSDHLALQTRKCPYNKILRQLRKPKI